MLRIRQEQIERIQAARETDFNRSSARFYRKNYPTLVRKMNDQELEQRISDAVKAARALGVCSSESTTQYVALAILAGPSFTTDPKINTFLTRPGLSADRRVGELLARVVSKLRGTRNPVGSGSSR